jgi:hypothetical protein
MVDVHEYRKSNICNKWDEDELIYKDCKVKLQKVKNGGVSVTGLVDINVISNNKGVYVKFWAPSPADEGQSFNSGLPFPNKEIAYDGTENIGIVNVEGNSFKFFIKYPNSYYADLGMKYIEPEARFRLYNNKGKRISNIYIVKLGSGIPYRTLNHHDKHDELFYSKNKSNSKIRTQAQILTQSSYHYKPSQRNGSFWNNKPPM